MANILKSSIPYRGPSSENLIEFIFNGLEKHSDREIIVDSASERVWKGQEVGIKVSRLSKFLLDECKLEKGKVCVLYGDTNSAMVLLNLAVICAGGVSTFLTNKYKPRELVDVARSIGASYIIGEKSLLEASRYGLEESGLTLRIVCVDGVCDGFCNGCTSINHLLEDNSNQAGYTRAELVARTSIVPGKDLAVIQFSSGTTGKPKPIPRTHKNLCHLVASVDHEQLMDLKPGEVIAGSLPLTHRPGLWALLACINGGSKFVLWTNLSDVEDALRIMEKYSVTIFSSSLPLLAMIANHGVRIKERFNLSSLKHIITSGSKIVHPNLPETIVREFNLTSLRQCFGMTESGWVFLIEQSLAKDNYLTVGHVCPGSEVAVLDRRTWKPVGAEVRGELAVRGPQIFPGYLTGQGNAFNRSDFTSDGWFKCGDQIYYDSNELVFIEGRFKEMLILSNNQRFFPNEIETVISEHPSIEGVCVVKLRQYTDMIQYDIARAYVTLKSGCTFDEKELMEFIRERASRIVMDGGIRVLDKFPRLENGKVNKQALLDLI